MDFLHHRERDLFQRITVLRRAGAPCSLFSDGATHFTPQHGVDSFSPSPPQQGASGPPQEQLSISFPRRAALIIAQAQPTPLCTSIAWVGQLRAHAPHSMQSDGRASSARFSPSAKTEWGQTCVQRLQLMHRSG